MVGTIWSAFLADLRLWALVVGALGVVAAAAFEPGAPGRGAARADGRAGAGGEPDAARARRRDWCVLAVLLLWMPEVPLDLAVVAAAGMLVFTGAAEVVRMAQRSLIR